MMCFLCSLTFEVSGRQRQDAKPVQCRINHRTARAWWPADGAPLDRGVRPHSWALLISDEAQQAHSMSH